jgi:hypothetical protein
MVRAVMFELLVTPVTPGTNQWRRGTRVPFWGTSGSIRKIIAFPVVEKTFEEIVGGFATSDSEN